MDEAGHEAGLADAEPAEHANFLLNHGRLLRCPESSERVTRNDARRLRCLSASVVPDVSGAVLPTPVAVNAMAVSAGDRTWESTQWPWRC